MLFKEKYQIRGYYMHLRFILATLWDQSTNALLENIICINMHYVFVFDSVHYWKNTYGPICSIEN